MEALMSYPGGTHRHCLGMQGENSEIQSSAGAEEKEGCEGNHVLQKCTDSEEKG